MVSFTFRYSTTKTGEYAKELFSELPITENRIEKLLLVHFCFFFYLPLLFRQTVEKLHILFGSQCNISACAQDFPLKFGMLTKFDTLISNLKSYFQNKINMTSS